MKLGKMKLGKKKPLKKSSPVIYDYDF